MSDYNFEDAFDEQESNEKPTKKINKKKQKPESELTSEEKEKKARNKLIFATALSPKRTRAIKAKISVKTFNGDPRTNFKIVDCCANCLYSTFPRNRLRRGFCAIATEAKFKAAGKPLLLPVRQNNLQRNITYAEQNWVKVHATTYCDAYKDRSDARSVSMTKRWIEK